MHWVNKRLHNCKYTQSFTGWTNLCFCTLLSWCVLRCVKLNMRYFVSICLCHQPSRFLNVVTYLFLQQYAQFYSVCLIFHCQLRRRLSGTTHFSSQRQQNFTVPGKHLLLLKISLQIIFPFHKNRSTMDTFLL